MEDYIDQSTNYLYNMEIPVPLFNNLFKGYRFENILEEFENKINKFSFEEFRKYVNEGDDIDEDNSLYIVDFRNFAEIVDCFNGNYY